VWGEKPSGGYEPQGIRLSGESGRMLEKNISEKKSQIREFTIPKKKGGKSKIQMLIIRQLNE